MASGNDPNDLMQMLAQLAQLTQKLNDLNQEAGLDEEMPIIEQGSQPAEIAPLPGFVPGGEQHPRTPEELLIGLTERLEQFASQSEERSRRLEAKMEKVEKLLEELVAKKGE